jgi:hypothetical protein
MREVRGRTRAAPSADCTFLRRYSADGYSWELVALATGKDAAQAVRTRSSCVRVARIVSVSRSAAIDA